MAFDFQAKTPDRRYRERGIVEIVVSDHSRQVFYYAATKDGPQLIGKALAPMSQRQTIEDLDKIIIDALASGWILTGRLWAPPVFTCPDCGMTSHNQNDIAHKYCGNCRTFPEQRALVAPVRKIRLDT